MNFFSNNLTWRKVSLAAAVLIAAEAGAQKVEEKQDGSWVTLKGTVASESDDSFVLDYGEGMVTVETDDWDNFSEAVSLMAGDSVRVYGMVDDDFYESKTIEADSIYVDDMNTLLTDPSPADEESATAVELSYYAVPVDYDFQVTGTVTSTSGREFKVDTGARAITVDTTNLAYNPMDDTGFQQIKEGDQVTVFGDLDYDVFGSREVLAEQIVTLN